MGLAVLLVYFNSSPKRQTSLEEHICKYPNVLKSKLLPLCRTRWVKKINALEVALDLLEIFVDTFSDMIENTEKNWNRDTAILASSLLKRIDFEFIINLYVVLTQKVIVYTAGITTSLQKIGIDLVSLNDQIQLVVRTLQNVRKDVSNFHHDCYEQATMIAEKIDVEVKMPQICGRQTHRRNALPGDQADQSPEQLVVTIPILDDVITSLQQRFSAGQDVIMKGMALLPSLGRA